MLFYPRITVTRLEIWCYLLKTPYLEWVTFLKSLPNGLKKTLKILKSITVLLGYLPYSLKHHKFAFYTWKNSNGQFWQCWKILHKLPWSYYHITVYTLSYNNYYLQRYTYWYGRATKTVEIYNHFLTGNTACWMRWNQVRSRYFSWIGLKPWGRIYSHFPNWTWHTKWQFNYTHRPVSLIPH